MKPRPAWQAWVEAAIVVAVVGGLFLSVLRGLGGLPTPPAAVLSAWWLTSPLLVHHPSHPGDGVLGVILQAGRWQDFNPSSFP